MKLYVGSLSSDVTEDELRSAFEQFGQVESTAIIKDKDSGLSKGFGFVEMGSKEQGQAAIDGLNGKDLNGKALAVNEARPRTESRGNRGGGYGGGRGGQGGGRGGQGGGRGGQGGGRGGQGGGRGGQDGGRGGQGGGRGGQGTDRGGQGSGRGSRSGGRDGGQGGGRGF